MFSPAFGQPLDVISWQAAWDTLTQRSVTSDDEMHDYSISQAYRSLAHAFAAEPPTAASSPPSSGHGVLRLLSLGTLLSAAQRATAVFIFVKLLVEEGSTHGESNRVPEVLTHMPQWIASYAALCLPRHTTSAASSNVADRRKLSMGFSILLREGVVCLSNTLRPQGVFICSMLPELVRVVIEVVNPLVASLAEGLDDDMCRRVVAAAAEAPECSAVRRGPPTRRTVECNVTLLVLCHVLLEDVVAADTTSSHNSATPEKEPKKRLVAVDTSLGPLMWDAEGTFTKAINRHEQWLRDSALRVKETFRASHQKRSETIDTVDEELTASLLFSESERWALTDLVNLWTVEVSEPLRRQYQELDAALLANRRGFAGVETKDVASIRGAQWGLTMRLCVLVTSIARGIVDPFVNSDSALRQQQSIETPEEQTQVHQEIVKGLVGQVGHHIPQLEGAETQHQSLVARMTMLSVASTLFFTFPMEAHQEQLWSSCCATGGAAKNYTEMFHQALLMRPLHFRDVVVVRLATLVSSSILHSVAGSARYNAVDIGGEELLELMRSGRDDGASRAAVQMVAMACMTRPHAMIPSLFKLLEDKDHKAARDNALDVLDCLPRLLTASSTTTFALPHKASAISSADDTHSDLLTNRAKRIRRSQEDRLSEVIRILGNHLLLSLGHDEELHHRQHAASLFAMMDPADVVRPLVVMQLKQDTTGKRRDAATKALAAVLLSGGLRKRVENVESEGNALDGRLNGIAEFLSTCCSLISAKREDELGAKQPPSQGGDVVDSTESSRAPRTPADIFMMASLQQLNDSAAIVPVPHDVVTSNEAPSPKSLSDLSKRLLQIVSTTTQQWATTFVTSTTPSAVEFGGACEQIIALLQITVKTGTGGDANHSSSATTDIAHQLAIRAATSTIVGAMSPLLSVPATKGKSIPLNTEAFEERSSSLCAKLVDMLCGTLLAVVGDGQAHQDELVQASPPQHRTFVVLFSLLCLKAIPSSVLHMPSSTSSTSNMAPCLVRCLAGLETSLGTAGPHTVDAVRKVTLEVMCKLPLPFVLPLLRQEASLFMDALRNTTAADDKATPSSACIASSVAYRAYLFVLQHQTVMETTLPLVDDTEANLTVPAASLPSRQSRAVALEKELQEFTLPMVCDVLLWHVLASTGRDESMGSLPLHQVLGEESCTKLWLSGIDALALLFVSRLRKSSSAMLHETDDPPSSLWEAVFGAVMAPLSWEPALLRDTIINPTSAVDAESLKAGGLKRVARTVWLSILQASVKIVVQQEAVSRGWVRLWARAVLPPVIKAANALVATASRSPAAAADSVAAVRRLIAPMFALVVLRPPQHPSAAHPSTEDADEDSGRLLSLDPEDESALLDFSLGCLGYEAQPLIQFEGIKLAAACIGRLPQRALLEGHQQQRQELSTGVSGAGRVTGASRMDVMMSRLSRMAMMHPVAEARQLAEQVVGMLTTPSAA
jgi:hypothetical protein